jgi:hypothetical protein
MVVFIEPAEWVQVCRKVERNGGNVMRRKTRVRHEV